MSRRTYQWLALGLVPLIAVLAVIGTAGAAPKGGLTVDLKVAQSDFRASQDVLVTVTLTNRGKQPARILKWFTPADGVDESLFTVTRDGQPVAYTGAHVKRPAATSGDYLQLDPGASVSNVVDLADLYDFSGTGRYEISYNVASYGLFGAIPVQGGAGVRHDQPQGGGSRRQGKAAAGSASWSGPDRLQLMLGRPDLSAGRRAHQCEGLRGERGELLQRQQAGRRATPRGSASSHRRGTRPVTSHFNAISSAMTNAGITFDCKSKQKVYAYVYPEPAVHDLPRHGLLDGAGPRHRFAGRHADPRDEPLRRRCGHR